MTESLSSLARDARVLLEVGDAMAELVDTYAAYPMPDGAGPRVLPWAIGRRNVCRARRQAAHRDGTLTWADQLALAHLETLACEDPAQLRDWLLKHAAVAALWVSDLDRRHTDNPAYAAAHVDRFHLREVPA
jgi:hypothetical protein